MRIMTDKVLERTIGFLITMYINRRISEAKTIIKRGGRPIMNFRGKLGKLALTIAVMETTTIHKPTGNATHPVEVTESEPYKVFDLNLNMEGQETDQTIEMEELKTILTTGKELISEGRDKLYVPLIGLFDKYLDRGMKLGETYANKVMDGMKPQGNNLSEKIDNVSAQVAVVQDTIEKQAKPQQ